MLGWLVLGRTVQPSREERERIREREVDMIGRRRRKGEEKGRKERGKEKKERRDRKRD